MAESLLSSVGKPPNLPTQRHTERSAAVTCAPGTRILPGTTKPRSTFPCGHQKAASPQRRPALSSPGRPPAPELRPQPPAVPGDISHASKPGCLPPLLGRLSPAVLCPNCRHRRTFSQNLPLSINKCIVQDHGSGGKRRSRSIKPARGGREGALGRPRGAPEPPGHPLHPPSRRWFPPPVTYHSNRPRPPLVAPLCC